MEVLTLLSAIDSVLWVFKGERINTRRGLSAFIDHDFRSSLIYVECFVEKIVKMNIFVKSNYVFTVDR